MKKHQYSLALQWTGNKGQGTKNYTAYSRDYEISLPNKTTILGSSDPAFRGDPTRHNPEEMLLSAVSSCHLLWYLHLCSAASVVVVNYQDNPIGTMVETADGGGYFSEITLHPKVVVSDESMVEMANSLHKRANELCFIANSCNFPIHHVAECVVELQK
jgi:organic hydroperoxide reductase OsmC/OhrA